MKLNIAEIMMLIFVLAYFLSILYCSFKIARTAVKWHFESGITVLTKLKVANYIRQLVLEDFNIYEKYDIWRFCIHE
ncbi:hypothetical protein [Geosporobacter ferrireducens]|uniref:Uncharacterized protein n=1 Tax=Geosporobacter ferrireducens TaxID=1424294 RepID=A0A1D8GC21_9FIRM|nr:hypothetical protein [Geosporobacter ferrireducens]AOT68475.1 hypothetical protein Gferi_02035 [Geosporobacter ferrireducens]MTI53937.1 hypothetical protein [Geosporobacter ferrireducens]